MRKRTLLKRLLCFVMAAALVCGIPGATALAKTPEKKTYPDFDAFGYSLTSSRETYRGIQGAINHAAYGTTSHTLFNVFLDDCISNERAGDFEEYTYQGKTYYFRMAGAIAPAQLRLFNNQNMTVSIVFLMRYVSGKEYLIDEYSRVQGYKYYAPAYGSSEGNKRGSETLTAFWHYLMEKLTEKQVHIDNFILGNEVNMPNHWHYSGTLDPNTVVVKYANAFNAMYSAVREYSKNARCSVSVDHSWQHNDDGSGIATKVFLDCFNSFLPGVDDWCISYHMYPSVLIYPQFWQLYEGMDLNPVSSDARFVDGRNLAVMTNYVKNTYGEKHRIMMTEEGFTDYYGQDIQAASLAYSYYAAKYDPMVDCFILHIDNEGGMQNFSIAGKLAQQVWEKLDSDPGWVGQTCLPTIGVSSWDQIIPNYKVGWPQARSLNGFILDGDYVFRMYKDGEVDKDYSGWYDHFGRLYLLKEGVEQGIEDIPGKTPYLYQAAEDFEGWCAVYYPTTQSYEYKWHDKGAQGNEGMAKSKMIYDSRSNEWYVVDENGDVVFGECKINGKTYKCDEKTGVFITMDGLIDGKLYKGKDVDTSYSGWYTNAEDGKTYLLKQGVVIDQKIPAKSEVDEDYIGWYIDEGSYYWMDKGLNGPAKDKMIYDSLTEAGFVLNSDGEVVFESYEIDGIMYKCNPESGAFMEKKEVSKLNLEWCVFGGKSFWYEKGARQGTYEDKKGVIFADVKRGREICDNEIKDEKGNGTWFWLDANANGAKACNKEVWMPYIYQGEENWDEEMIVSTSKLSGDMAAQVERAIRDAQNGVTDAGKVGKWVRYDKDGKMIKGWYTVEGADEQLYPSQVGNTYYYDYQTGLMAKGTVVIDGRTYRFDETTGVLIH